MSLNIAKSPAPILSVHAPPSTQVFEIDHRAMPSRCSISSTAASGVSTSWSGPDGLVGAAVDIAVFTDVGEARNVINVLSSDVVVACGVEGAGTASEVALALKLARPTVLLAPSPEAAVFFRSMETQASLHEVDTPEAAVELIEHRLGIARWSLSKT